MEPKDELERERFAKLERLQTRGINVYPARVRRTHTTAQARTAFETSEGQLLAEKIHVAVTGRLVGFRTMGKASFGHIEDGAGRLQLYWRKDDIGDESYQILLKDTDLGDFIEAEGEMFRTRTGEVSLHVRAWRIVSKSLQPLPIAKEQIVDGQVVRYSAFKDVEARYRERYADLAVNPDVREIFRTRARIVAALRRFLDDHGFLEVETPILQPIYGGAAARPFITHHNQLHQDLYLRISFELYLKRLLVGGYERVYEIGRDFRNEGISFKHNPEFTQLEFYMAYADYRTVMDLTEEMIVFVADTVLGRRQIVYDGNTIDLSPPWPRIPLAEAILDKTGIDYRRYPDRESLAAAMRAAGMEVKASDTRGKLIDQLLSQHVEPKLIQPTFLYDYPRDVSPLAKAHPDDPATVERFEGFVGGMEICNAFSELNDPIDQEARFREQGFDYAAGDEEAHPMDEDYLNALKYGMPPNGGFGMGIDRLTMLLTGQDNIREVILFPHLRSRA